MSGVVFEWDKRKDEINQEKHGISFRKARKAFEDSNSIIIEDLDHSTKEKRYFCLGKVKEGVLTVRFTYRDNIIRFIGAGFWRKGRRRYEQEIQKKR